MKLILAKDKLMLKTDRQIRLRGALKKAGLIGNLEFSAFWTDAEKDVERDAFAQADAVYESDKTSLRDALKSLSHDDLVAWFAEHDLPTATDIDEYLPVSP